MSIKSKGDAKIQATNVDINSLTYKGGNVSDTIHRELVKRTELHPTYDGEELEERIYYSLHNDASKCVFVSPHLQIEILNRESSDTIPNSIIDLDKAPTTIIPIPYDDDEEWIVTPPTPTPPVIPNQPIRTDFDNYAAKLLTTQVSTGQTVFYRPKEVQCLKDVTKFYEDNSHMLTARSAMRGTRSPMNEEGRTLDETYKVLKNGESMYEKSNIKIARLSIPELENGESMFKECKYLEGVQLLDANNLKKCISMCEDASTLSNFTLSGDTNIHDTTKMFKGCRRLDTVIFDKTDDILYIDEMFQNCGVPKVKVLANTSQSNSQFPSAISGKFALSGTLFKTVDLDFPKLEDGSYMLSECKRLKQVKATSSLPKMIKAEGMYKNCTSLVSDMMEEYPELTYANQMYSGCESLLKVKSTFKVLEDVEYFFANCKMIKISDISGQFPVIKHATGMFEGCVRMDKVVGTFNKLDTANDMFSGCVGLKTISMTCPLLQSVARMFKGCSPIGVVKFDAPQVNDFTEFLMDTQSLGFTCNFNINPKYTNRMFKGSSIIDFTNNGSMNRLEEADEMFADCNQLVSIIFGAAPLMKNIDSLLKTCINLRTFTGAFVNVTSCDSSLFKGCPRLRAVDINLASLTDGTELFRYLSELEVVRGQFDSLTEGKNMFRDCPRLSEVPEFYEVINGLGMFQGTNISKLPVLPKLQFGRQTFQNCKNLKGHLELITLTSLANGINMFNGCTGLTSVGLTLNSATDIRNMFAFCENITSITTASFAEGVTATSLLPHSKVDSVSFNTVYQAIKDKNAVADVNNCICHVGINSDILPQLQEMYGDLMYQWEGNQYAVKISADSNNFVMAVAN